MMFLHLKTFRNYKQSLSRIYNKLGNTDTVRQIITWSGQFSANFLKLGLYSLLYYLKSPECLWLDQIK